MPTTSLMPSPRQRFYTNGAVPAAGCLLYTYAAGTSTPLATYTDAAGLVPHPNPITLDSKGEALIYWAGAYRVDLRTAAGAQITGYPVDNFESLDPAALPNALRAELAASTGGGLVGMVPAGAGTVATSIEKMLNRMYGKNLFDFMTAAQIADVEARTLTMDVSAAVQAWVTYCELSGRTGFAPSGSYKITQQIVKPASPYAPALSGDGAARTVFVYSGIGACMKAQGGSGTTTEAWIGSIGFVGNGSNYGVEVADQCGFQVRDCSFNDMAIGMLVHNATPGGFTEYVIGVDCQFASTCRQALVYRRTGGNDSFHGSGLRNYLINESTTEIVPKIEIGGSLSTNQDIIVYNSVLSGQCWKQTATPFIRNNTSRTATNFHGDLTFETFGAVTYDIATGTQATYHIGTVGDLNNAVRHGNMVFCESFSTRPDGAVFATRKPYKLLTKTMAAGAVANSICTLYAIADETYMVRVVFQSSASPWKRVYLLGVHISTATSAVTVISDLMSYFAGDYTAPTFSMSGSTLIATGAVGWPAATISCEVTVSQVGHCSASIF